MTFYWSRHTLSCLMFDALAFNHTKMVVCPTTTPYFHFRERFYISSYISIPHPNYVSNRQWTPHDPRYNMTFEVPSVEESSIILDLGTKVWDESTPTTLKVENESLKSK